MNSAKQALERVRDAMKKYPAVEFRWKSERGVSLDVVEKLLLELKEKVNQVLAAAVVVWAAGN